MENGELKMREEGRSGSVSKSKSKSIEGERGADNPVPAILVERGAMRTE